VEVPPFAPKPAEADEAGGLWAATPSDREG
jgi:hypothetical protein